MIRWVRRMPFVLIGIIFIVTLLGGFFAPYRFDSEHREDAYAPPSKLHFVYHGRFIGPHFFERQIELDEFHRKIYLEKTDQPIRIQLFVRSEAYRLLGLFNSNIHLFGSKNSDARFYALGTDKRGRDIFSRIIYGGQISLSIGVIGVVLSSVIALVIGGISGFFGGWIDHVLMRLAEWFIMIPAFYILLALRGALPMSLDSKTVYLIIVCVLSVLGWGGLARTIRGMVLSLRNEDYVLAARALGVSNITIISRHIIPHLWSVLAVVMSVMLPGFLLSETTLSMIGLGVQDPYASWGSLLSEAVAISRLELHPWILTPGIILIITIFCFNYIGDYLRDWLDPKKSFRHE